MDVVKSTIKLICFLISISLVAGCDSSDDPQDNGNIPFQSPDSDNCDAQRIPNQYLVKWDDGTITIEKSPNDEAFVNNFISKQNKKILFFEPHFQVSMIDPKNYTSLGYGGEVNWGVEKIEAQSAWNQNFQGQNIIVAVIDSGLDTNHAELPNILAINEIEEINDLDDDNNGLVDDRYGYDFVEDSSNVTDKTGHGTHVTGIIAANHQSGAVFGVAPQAKILPLNFIDSSGRGLVISAIQSIRYAADRGARVINASWGGNSCSLALKQEIEALQDNNILFVSAAGNSGNDLGESPEYPAAFNIANHISVGASTFNDETTGFSNYGEAVAVVAPGANIISTFPIKYDTENKAGEIDGLYPLDGTSMAAPFVAGMAAVLWSARPNASFTVIKEAIVQGVNKGPFPVQTRGQVNLQNSLSWLLQQIPE